MDQSCRQITTQAGGARPSKQTPWTGPNATLYRLALSAADKLFNVHHLCAELLL
jgi:hypothetical protein